MLGQFANWAANAPPVWFWLIAIVVALISVGSIVSGFRSLRRARLIADMPTSRIRSAPQGYCELVGTGQWMTDDNIIAPLSKKNCLWWQYSIEQRVRSGKSVSWRSVRSDTSDAMFLLKDDTGTAVIDPERAEVFADEKDRWYGFAGWPETGPALGAYFGNYRYSEKRISANGPIYALGLFRSEYPLERFDTNEAMKLKLAHWKKDERMLLARFDANGDGKIDMDEWQEVRAAAAKEIDAQRRELSNHEAIHLLSKPPDGRPFIIATSEQDGISRSYMWRWYLGLAGFFIFGTAGVWMMTARLAN